MKLKHRTLYRVYAPGFEDLGLFSIRYSRRQAFILALKYGPGSTVHPFRKYADGRTVDHNTYFRCNDGDNS